MKIFAYENFDSLSEPHLGVWAELSAHSPMLSPEWVIPWWRTYQKSLRGKLCFLVGIVDDQLVGIAPFYIEGASRKRTLRFLGDGHVCSDYLTLLSRPEHEEDFVGSVADWLQRGLGESWRDAYWECVPEQSQQLTSLADLLGDRLSVYQRPACSSWYVELPATWDEYLSRLSKNHRKRCRRWFRQWIESGELEHVPVTKVEQLDQAFRDLCQLHNARRNSIGSSGAFEDSEFFEFHRSATRELFANNQLRLSFLRKDSEPIACEYQLVDEHTVYSYQSGFDPQYKSIGVGNISLMMAIKTALDDGYRTFDFLRGSESYKQSWAADESKTLDIHINDPNTITGSLEQAKLGTKDWLRSVKSVLTGSGAAV